MPNKDRVYLRSRIDTIEKEGMLGEEKERLHHLSELYRYEIEAKNQTRTEKNKGMPRKETD